MSTTPEGAELLVLQIGCFKYFELGGEMVNGPVTLLAGYVASAVDVLVSILTST